jgi:hypothetical protein
LTTNLTLMSNRALRLMFARAADGLPLSADAVASAAGSDLLRRPGRVDVV